MFQDRLSFRAIRLFRRSRRNFCKHPNIWIIFTALSCSFLAVLVRFDFSSYRKLSKYVSNRGEYFDSTNKGFLIDRHRSQFDQQGQLDPPKDRLSQPLKKAKKIFMIIRPEAMPSCLRCKMFNSSKIQFIFRILSETLYEEVINLDIIITAPQVSLSSSRPWNGDEFIPHFNWIHGTMRIRECHCQGGLEYIANVWNPLLDESESILIVDVASVKSIPPKWYSFLKSARKRYQSRQDILAISTSTVDHISHVKFAEISTHSEPNVVLWPGVTDDSIYYIFSASIWSEFLNWLERHRGDWYLWPTMIKARSRKDEERWMFFNSTIRAPWQLWISRFAVVYNIYLLYPLISESFHDSKRNGYMKDSRTLNIARYFLNGSLDRSWGSSRVSRVTINSILKFSGYYNDTVSFTFVNANYLQTALSWICNVDVGGFRPPGIVWVATDDESFNRLKQVPDSFAVRAKELEGGRKGNIFGSTGYWLLMLERTFLIKDMLNEGCTVFLFEVDQVWLRDPVPYIDRLFTTTRDLDLVGTLDAAHEIGGNFLIIKPTLVMRKVYSEICKRFEKSFQLKLKRDVQAVKNSLIENDQTLLSNLVLFEEPFRSRYPVVFRALDIELFACGQWYMGTTNRYNTSRAKSPILVNNNWIQGVSAKTMRMKKFGHWFLTDNGTCSEEKVRNAISINEQNDGGNTIGIPRPSKYFEPQKITGEDVEANLSFLESIIHFDQLG